LLEVQVSPKDICVVLVTVPAIKAEALARAVVEKKVAACVNVLSGVHSFYFWEGKVQDDAENLLMIKTTRGAFDRLKDAILSMHPYELPEIIALPVTAAHEPYADWVERSVA
jgi:periplasmic divalent cation tolerance protein